MNTTDLGEIAVLKVSQVAIKKGFIVSRPTVECRYDLVIDENGKLLRTQVKYCNTRCTSSRDSVHLKLVRSFRRNSGNCSRPYSKNEVDQILVYLPSIDKIVKLGPEIFNNKKNVSIMIREPKLRRKGQIVASEHEW